MRGRRWRSNPPMTTRRPPRAAPPGNGHEFSWRARREGLPEVVDELDSAPVRPRWRGCQKATLAPTRKGSDGPRVRTRFRSAKGVPPMSWRAAAAGSSWRRFLVLGLERAPRDQAVAEPEDRAHRPRGQTGRIGKPEHVEDCCTRTVSISTADWLGYISTRTSIAAPELPRTEDDPRRLAPTPTRRVSRSTHPECFICARHGDPRGTSAGRGRPSRAR